MNDKIKIIVITPNKRDKVLLRIVFVVFVCTSISHSAL
jgi:hypothetical protein